MGNRLQRLGLSLFILLSLSLTRCATTVEEPTSEEAQTQTEIQEEGEKLVGKEVKEPTPVFIWPLKKYKRLSRGFKPGHNGLDIPAPTGTSIFAAAPGRVIYSGHVFKGYGNMVLIEHARGLATIYGHLSKLFVKSGQFLEKHSIIGLVGRTGRASAPHLHFEVRLHKKPVDPRRYLP